MQRVLDRKRETIKRKEAEAKRDADKDIDRERKIGT